MTEPLTVPTILIVEDDGPSRQLLRRRLERQGMAVLEAEDGPSALALLARQTPTAMVLDIGLPGMDGLAVLRQLRLQHSALDLPVLMATAYDADTHLPDALALGANDFVNKPIDFAILLARLRTQLHLQRSVRAERLLTERQALVLEGSNDGIWEWDISGERIRHSRRWSAILQDHSHLDAESLLDDWLQRIHPQDRHRVETRLQEVLSGKEEAFSVEYRLRNAHGRYLWILTRGALERDQAGKPLQAAGTHTDISELRYRDRQTGLLLSQSLLDSLLAVQEEAERLNQGWALVSFRLLDSSGYLQQHSESEGLLQELVSILRRTPDLHGVAVDDGPYSLLLLFRDTDPRQDFRGTLTQAQSLLNDGLRGLWGRSLGQSLWGVRLRQEGPLTDPALCRQQARGAMRLAMERQQDVVYYSAEVQERLDHLARLNHELVDAIDYGAIHPWWQPLVWSDGGLAGFEVLARWQRPDGSVISPMEFIPLVEKAGLMEAMTLSLLGQAMGEFKNWQQRQDAPNSLYFAMNFPPALLTEGLDARLSQQLQAQGLAPHQLCIEVTESNAVADFAKTGACLQALADAGFRLALDDFGTGYASLNTLHRLPFHTLKIDQSFVRQMVQGQGPYSLIRAIIAMGQSLGLTVVAEGVETQEQVEILRGMGVNRLQGHYFAAPMPSAQVSHTWRDQYPMPGIS